MNGASATKAALRTHEPGDAVAVTIVRDRERRQLRVTLADRPG